MNSLEIYPFIIFEIFAVFISIFSLLECTINEYARTANIIDIKVDIERDK